MIVKSNLRGTTFCLSLSWAQALANWALASPQEFTSRVVLVREKNNEFDENAIKVLIKDKNNNFQHIGYIEAPIARIISPILNNNGTASITHVDVYTHEPNPGFWFTINVQE